MLVLSLLGFDSLIHNARVLTRGLLLHVKPLDGLQLSLPPFSLNSLFSHRLFHPLSNRTKRAPGGRAKRRMESRRAACTHMTMTRLYGFHKCQGCHTYPSMGWVYCCTQDLSSISRVHPDTAHGHQEPGNHGNINLNVGRPAEYCNVPNYYQLSSREVNELYTPQQLRIIRAQKYNIAVTAATQAALAGDIAQRSPTTPSQEPLPPPGSVLPSLSALLSSISSSLTPTGPHRQPLHSNPLTCQWKCCPRCRPASRDRAWVSLAAVLHDDIGPFHGLESNDIPISPRDVVCNLGLRQPPPPPFWMDEPLSTPDESSDSDLALTRTSVQAHMNNPTGFRASVRRAFRQMLMSNRRNHQDTVSPYSYNTAAAPSTSSTSGLSTLTELGEDDGDYQDDGSLEQDQDVDEFDIAFYAQLNDAVLTEAAETALPEEREYEPVEDNDEDEESEDGDEGFGSEPVEVHGGVAVTEEAVQMREADVMTQV